MNDESSAVRETSPHTSTKEIMVKDEMFRISLVEHYRDINSLLILSILAGNALTGSQGQGKDALNT